MFRCVVIIFLNGLDTLDLLILRLSVRYHNLSVCGEMCQLYVS